MGQTMTVFRGGRDREWMLGSTALSDATGLGVPLLKALGRHNVPPRPAGGVAGGAKSRAVASRPLLSAEPLEPRLLLSADLLPGAQDVLLRGLGALGDRLDDLILEPVLSQNVPIIDRPLGELVHARDIVDGVRSAASDYFAGIAAGATATVEGLVAELDTLAGSLGPVTHTVNGSDHRLGLSLSATEQLAGLILDLSGSIPDADLVTTGNIALAGSATARLDLSLGLDLATSTFFLGSAALGASVDAGAPDIDASIRFQTIDLTVTDGSALLHAEASGSFVDPDNADGRGIITLAELEGTPLDVLLTASVTGNANLQLPFSSSLLPTAETLGVTWTGGLQGSNATVNFAPGSLLQNLLHLDQADFETMLRSFFDQLPQIVERLADALPKNLPVLDDALASLYDLADKVQDAIAAVDQLLDTATATLQQVISTLETVTGLDVDAVLAANEIRFAFDFARSISTDLPVSIRETVLGQLLTFEGTAHVEGSAKLGVEVGIDISGAPLTPAQRIYLVEGANSAAELALLVTTPTLFAGSANLGPARLTLTNGQVAVAGSTGNAIDTTKQARARIGLVDDRVGGTADGRITLDDLIADPLAIVGPLSTDIFAHVSADLGAEFLGEGTPPLPIAFDWNIGAGGAPQVTVDSGAFNTFVQGALPALVDGAINAAQAALMQQLSGWFQDLGNFLQSIDVLQRDLPLVNESILDLIGANQLLTALGEGLSSAAGAAGSLTSGFGSRAQVAIDSRLRQLTDVQAVQVTGAVGNLFQALTDADATRLGFSTAGDRLVYSLRVAIDQRKDKTVSLTGDSDLAGLTLGGTMRFGLRTVLEITFGIDLTPDIAPEDAIFVKVKDLSVALNGALLGSADVSLGMFGSAQTTGAVSYDGGVAIAVGGRGATARVLTIGDLTGSTAEGLIAVNVTASNIAGALNVTTRLPTGAQLAAQLTFGGDPFNGGITQFDFTGPTADDLRNLVDFDAADLMSVLRQTLNWLNQLSDSSYLDIRLPFVDQTLGGLLDLGTNFAESVIDPFFDKGADLNSAADDVFLGFRTGATGPSTIEGFRTRLATLLGINVANLPVSYDAATDVLSIGLQLNNTLDPLAGVGVSFAAGFGDFAGIRASASNLSIALTSQFGLTIAFDMSANGRRLQAVRAPVSTGRLTQDAVFDLAAGSQTLQVTVRSADTASNAGINDLASDLRAAISAALTGRGLAADAIAVTVEDGKFVLASSNPAIPSLSLQAALTNTAVTQLGFTDQTAAPVRVVAAGGTLAADGRLSGDASFNVVVDGVSLGTVTVRASATAAPQTDAQGHVIVQGNVRPSDLVTDINAALSPINTTLGAQGKGIRADLDTTTNRLVFVATNGAVSSIQITTPATGTARTELGLAASQTSGARSAIQQGGSDLLDRIALADFALQTGLTISGTFSAEAKLGPLEVAIPNASLNVTGAAGLVMSAPELTLRQFLANISSLDTYFDLNLTGSGNFTLPIAVRGPLATLLQVPNATFRIVAADLFNPSGWTTDFSATQDFLRFRNLDSADWIALVRSVATFLRELADSTDSSIFNEEIPVVGVKIGDAFDFIDDMAEAAERFAANPGAALADLQALLNNALRSVFGGVQDYVTIAYNRSTADLRFTVALAPTIAPVNLPLSFNLQSLGLGALQQLPGVGALVQVEGAGSITVTPSVNASLVFGFNLSSTDAGNPLLGFIPKPYIDSATGIELGLLVRNNAALSVRANIGPLSAELKSAAGNIRLSSTTDANAPARIRLGFSSVQPRYYFTELGDLGNFNYSGIGGSPITLTLNGLIDTTIEVWVGGEDKGDIIFDVTNLQNFFTALLQGGNSTQYVSVQVPDLSNLFSNLNLLNWQTIVGGVNAFLDSLEDMFAGRIFGQDIPVVGDALKSVFGTNNQGAQNFIRDLKRDFNALLGNGLATALSELDTTLTNALRPVLKGPADSAVKIFFKMPGDAGYTEFNGQNVDPIQVEDVRVDLDLGSVMEINSGIGFDIGLPGLGLKVDEASSVAFRLQWGVALSFGIDRNRHFYIRTDKQNEVSAEIFAGVGDQFSMLGELGFLQLTLTEDTGNDVPPSGVSGTLGIDLRGGGPDGKLYLATALDDLDVAVTGSLMADLDFNARLGIGFERLSNGSFGDSSLFPSIEGELRLHFNVLQPNDFSFGLNDLRLNFGEFVNEFLGPVVRDIQKVLEPVKPLIDFLRAPIPILSDFSGDPVTILSLASQIPELQSVTKFIEAVGVVSDIAGLVGNVGNNIYIEIGDFNFGGFNLSLPRGVAGGMPLNAGTSTSQFASFLSSAQSSMASSLHATPWASIPIQDDFGISVPFIQNPASLIGLLFGQTVDLIEIDLPTFSFPFQFPTITIPVYPSPPITLAFTGSLEFRIDLAFGYDSFGLKTYLSKPEASRDLTDLLLGFYISDDPRNTGAILLKLP